MPDDLSNIEVFNLTALRLFARLFDEFPVPVTIDAKDVGAETSMAAAETMNDTMRMIFYAEHAISWLAEEGFIRYEKGGPPFTTFTNVRLTLKGLTVLGYMPTALQAPDKPQSIISRVKSVLAAGAEKAGTDAVKSLLGEIFRLAMSPAAAQVPSSIISA